MSEDNSDPPCLKYCVVRFSDDDLVKVARSDLMRYPVDKSPFIPRSSQDLPQEEIEVKWQKSVSGENFSGYFAASVLAIGSKYESH